MNKEKALKKSRLRIPRRYSNSGGGRDRRQCNRGSRSSGSERCSGSVCSVWSASYGCEKVSRREMRIA